MPKTITISHIRRYVRLSSSLACLFAMLTAYAAGADAAQGILGAAGKGDTVAVINSLKAGEGIESRDKHGATPLMRSAENGNYNTAVKLIEEGADVNARDERMRTALMYAAKNGHVVVGRALIEAGSNVTLADREGNTARKLAEQGGHQAMSDALKAESVAAGPDEEAELAEMVPELYEAGRYEDAAKAGERLLYLRKERLGPDAPAVAEAEGNLAATYAAMGQHDKAARLAGASPGYQYMGGSGPPSLAGGKLGMPSPRNIKGTRGAGLSTAGSSSLDMRKAMMAAGAFLLALATGFVLYKTRAIQRLWRYDRYAEETAGIEFEKKKLYDKACALDKSGDYAKAAELYEKALEIDPKHTLARFKLARCYQFGVKNMYKTKEHYAVLKSQLPAGHPFHREAVASLGALPTAPDDAVRKNTLSPN